MYTLYAHMADVRVGINQYVEQGQEIGFMGNTGNSFGSHLHFEVFNSNNVRVNPEPYLNKDLDNNIGCTGTITYQIFANGHWYEEVQKADDTPQGYAGNGVDCISGVRAKPEFGKIYIRVHIINGSWLEEVCSDMYEANDIKNANSYAGIYNQPIDAVQIRCTNGWVDYRVMTSDGYLPWVRGNKNFENEIYAGNFGQPILGIQMV